MNKNEKFIFFEIKKMFPPFHKTDIYHLINATNGFIQSIHVLEFHDRQALERGMHLIQLESEKVYSKKISLKFHEDLVERDGSEIKDFLETYRDNLKCEKLHPQIACQYFDTLDFMLGEIEREFDHLVGELGTNVDYIDDENSRSSSDEETSDDE